MIQYLYGLSLLMIGNFGSLLVGVREETVLMLAIPYAWAYSVGYFIRGLRK